MAKVNLFGDVRAENDHAMLDSSFHESQSYRTLIESRDRFIVVGRRGTGKSALTYRLAKDWRARKFSTIVVAPTEEQVIGIRPVAEMFGDSVTRIRAGMKLAWRYTLLMEVAVLCEKNYKTAAEIHKYETLKLHLKAWIGRGDGPFDRIRATLREHLRAIANPEDRIADLPSLLQLNRITEEVTTLAQSLKQTIIVLIDRLDEGYEPDTVGVGIVDGIIYGTDEVRNALSDTLQAIVFLRDNIFRAVQLEDRDFSRNLEGQVLRLHWDPEELFYMVCKRIRVAFSTEKESDVKVWNSITAAELHGREGFKRCLRLTLYRPRDLIALLNAAIEQARRQQRTVLVEADFHESSKQISVTRFDDLSKEYAQVFPGIARLTTAFANGAAKFPVSHAVTVIRSVLDDPLVTADVLQHLSILGSAEEIAKALYGVGFFGIFDQQNSTWVFSHDGRRPDKSINQDDFLMVHPCYWNALNLQRDLLEQDTAEQIFDEYEITIHSQSTEQRATRLGQIISELATIPTGVDGASRFEEWCERAIEIAFAKELTNIQLHPNKDAVQRRDIVGTNQGIRGFWKRIRDDYETRQVIFEVKNFDEIGIEEYRQMNGYLAREYGRLGFIICRDKQPGLEKGRELEAFREFYLQGKVIVKITASTLTSILSKLRSPAKIDAGDVALDNQLDTHIRLYASGQSDRVSARIRKKKNRS
jgi:GTPase SAR1 family protein